MDPPPTAYDDALRLVLDLKAGEQTIEGRLSGPDGTGHPFRGWIELAALLESLRPLGDDPEPRDS